MSLVRAEYLQKNADKILNRYIYLFGNRYIDAQETYRIAANIYKVHKKYDLAIYCLK